MGTHATLIVALACCAAAATAQHTSTRLRVEYIERPLTIDVAIPRFSWALQHDARAQTQTCEWLWPPPPKEALLALP